MNRCFTVSFLRTVSRVKWCLRGAPRNIPPTMRERQDQAEQKVSPRNLRRLWAGMTLKICPQLKADSVSLYHWWHSGKGSAFNAGDLGLISGSGRFPGEGKGYPLQYSCLKNSTDRGAWLAPVHEWQRVRQLATNTFTFTLRTSQSLVVAWQAVPGSRNSPWTISHDGPCCQWHFWFEGSGTNSTVLPSKGIFHCRKHLQVRFQTIETLIWTFKTSDTQEGCLGNEKEASTKQERIKTFKKFSTGKRRMKKSFYQLIHMNKYSQHLKL